MTAYLKAGSAALPQADRVAGALGTDIKALLARPSAAPRTGMFGSRALHSPQELRDEQQACLAPVFQDILGNPKIQQRISQAMVMAQSTANRGVGSDIPANGSEQSFYAGKIPMFGAVTGSTSTLHRELQSSFDPLDMPWAASDTTAIHTHQSPRGEPGLSQFDINLTRPPPLGQNVNIVAVDRNGIRYCKVAG